METSEILRSYGHRILKPLLERYGCRFAPRPLPSQYRRGAMQVCFANSYRMAMRHDVTYVEGLAISSFGNVSQLHAWCVDDSGNVLDRTWGEAKTYLGIPFQTDYLRFVIRDRQRELGEDAYYGLLDDYRKDWPLATSLSEMPELWLSPLWDKWKGLGDKSLDVSELA